MASSHRVTDLEKNPVQISKDEAPTPLNVSVVSVDTLMCRFRHHCYSQHLHKNDQCT